MHTYAVFEHVYAVLEHVFAVLEHVCAVLEQGGFTDQDMLIFRKLTSRVCYKPKDVTKQDVLLLTIIPSLNLEWRP